MTKTVQERIARARRIAAKVLLLAALLVIAEVAGQEIQLPPAQTDVGKPLMQALKERRSARSFAEQALPPQVLSNLLWAAFGVNRPDGHRTAPSAKNWQEVDVYVALRDGLFVYDAKTHALKRVVARDLRALSGTQAHAREAPLTLIYVADEGRMGGANEETRRTFAAADTGFIAQNVYLFCASEGLATVVFASIDRDAFARAAGLRPDQKITLAQSVGYPKR
ncbi:MAG: SagB/ThcOx family dehydrogenase [Gemmatimonadota bacterium]